MTRLRFLRIGDQHDNYSDANGRVYETPCLMPLTPEISDQVELMMCRHSLQTGIFCRKIFSRSVTSAEGTLVERYYAANGTYHRLEPRQLHEDQVCLDCGGHFPVLK